MLQYYQFVRLVYVKDALPYKDNYGDVVFNITILFF